MLVAVVADKPLILLALGLEETAGADLAEILVLEVLLQQPIKAVVGAEVQVFLEIPPADLVSLLFLYLQAL
jgi:hypothetical protein